jgi:hypothetical protein
MISWCPVLPLYEFKSGTSRRNRVRRTAEPIQCSGLEGTSNVMRRPNCDTMLVVTGLLGTVIFATLVLAVQEHHPLPAEVAEKAMQMRGEVLPNASFNRSLRFRETCNEGDL